MSVTPITLPICTRSAVLDFLFQRKYSLTYTQLIVMYYIVMLKTWVKYKEEGFYVISSSKIEKDLGLNPKTVEGSLTQLKKLKLIETKRLKVEDWNANRTYRAIGLTELGKEYNLSFYKEKEYQLAKELKIENEEYRVQNSAIEEENMKLKAKLDELQLQNRSFEIHQEFGDELNTKAIEAIEKSKQLEIKLLKREKKIKELEKQIKIIEKSPTTPKEKNQKEEDLEDFRKKVIRQYSQSGKPICNAVNNGDSWSINTNFYINSYNRVTIYSPKEGSKQLKEPQQISNFWEWLFKHQHRVGELIDTQKVADVSSLLGFVGEKIFINDRVFKIESIKAVVGGATIVVENNEGDLINLTDVYDNKKHDVVRLFEVLKGYLVMPIK